MTRSLALFGAPLDSGNLGVAALGTSVIEGVARHAPGATVTLFDNGWGIRNGQLTTDGGAHPYRSCGARLSRRLHRSESLHTMHALAHLRGRANPGNRILCEAAAVLDVSGGDSFTDMYGPKRFRTVVLPKLLTARLQRPLILLPQTYGPFRELASEATAQRVLRGARMAWARDLESHHRLLSLLGDDADPERHRLGVDMAFGLSPVAPAGSEHDDLRAWLTNADRVVGINLSGLLMQAAPAGTTRDRLSLDYANVMHRFIDRLLAETNTHILLVPHVVGPSESDVQAVDAMLRSGAFSPERVRAVPAAGLTTAGEAKWWIGQCDWFTGSRMHSTIAALSSGVPAAALAYSLKTEPVFATVGQEGCVIDARSATDDAALAHLWQCWLDRDAARASLAGRLPDVREQADRQMAAIVSTSFDMTAQQVG